MIKSFVKFNRCFTIMTLLVDLFAVIGKVIQKAIDWPFKVATERTFASYVVSTVAKIILRKLTVGTLKLEFS